MEEARNNLKIYSKEESHELFSEKNHIHEINEKFNLNIRLDPNKINAPINFFSDGNLYHRAKYLDHLITANYFHIHK